MIILNDQPITINNKTLLKNNLAGYSVSIIVHQKDNIFKGNCLNKKEIESHYSFYEGAVLHLYLIEKASDRQNNSGRYLAINKENEDKWGIISISDHYESEDDYDNNIFFYIFGFTSLGLKLQDDDYTIYLNEGLNIEDRLIHLDILTRKNMSDSYFVKKEFIQKRLDLDKEKYLIETKMNIAIDILDNTKGFNKGDLVMKLVEMKSRLIEIELLLNNSNDFARSEELTTFAKTLIKTYLQ